MGLVGGQWRLFWRDDLPCLTPDLEHGVSGDLKHRAGPDGHVSYCQARRNGAGLIRIDHM